MNKGVRGFFPPDTIYGMAFLKLLPQLSDTNWVSNHSIHLALTTWSQHQILKLNGSLCKTPPLGYQSQVPGHSWFWPTRCNSSIPKTLLRSNICLKWFPDLTKALYLFLLVYYKEHEWTVRWRGTHCKVWKGPKCSSSCPHGFGREDTHLAPQYVHHLEALWTLSFRGFYGVAHYMSIIDLHHWPLGVKPNLQPRSFPRRWGWKF